jgi:hypothetical protein
MIAMIPPESSPLSNFRGALKVYELLFPGPPRDSSKQIIDAIAISCFNYALLLWPITAIETSPLRLSNPTAYSAF